MNYNFERAHAKGESDLLDRLSNFEFENQESSVAIIGGHFMLMPFQQTSLVPCIAGETEESKEKEFAKLMAGSFPEKTFEYSIYLYKSYRKRKMDAKIALVIDDHIFQSWEKSKKLTKDSKALKRDFYKKNELPVSYLDQLEKEKIELTDFFLDNNDRRKSGEILPSKTYFFSQQVFYNHFKNSTAKKTTMLETFNKKKMEHSYGLYFSSKARCKEFCIKGSNVSSCTVEVMETLICLFSRKKYNIVFFVPEECQEAASLGIEVAMTFHSNFNKNIIKSVVTVTDMGGNGKYGLSLLGKTISLGIHSWV